MCTVSFIPSGDCFYLCSSRDEFRDRPPAEEPEVHKIHGESLLYPRDPQGGGTWILAHESGAAGVLLNGGQQAHITNPPYRKSRGLVLLDFFTQPSPVDVFITSNLEQIEPFTVIIVENRNLNSVIWDGEHKTVNTLESLKPQIWSSTTLYDPPSIKKREIWFRTWLRDHPSPNAAEILQFHRHGGEGDSQTDICMNREEKLFTNSISLLSLHSSYGDFYYEDLRNGKIAKSKLPFLKPISINA